MRSSVINDIPRNWNRRQWDAVGVNSAVEDQDTALTGDGVLPGETGLPCAEKVGCAPDMPLH